MCRLRRHLGGLSLLAVCWGLLSCEKQKDPPAPNPSSPPAPLTAPLRKQVAPVTPGEKAPEEHPALVHLPERSGAAPDWGAAADASSKHGVVTSVDASATRAGISILEAGGNAVDAAIATALALAVTHPSAGNIGGGGFALVKVKKQIEAIDFRENSPEGLTTASFWKMIGAGGRGPASVGVPGTVAGLYLLHQRHGKLPWERLVEPAVSLAEKGYILGARQAKVIAWAAHDLRLDPVTRAAFFPAGSAPRSGTLIKRPKLGIALRRIQSKGALGFYEGETAQDLALSMGKEGHLSLSDLKNYQAVVREPLFFDFQGMRVVTMPAPSAGGVAVAQSLLMLDKLAISESKGAARYHLLAEVLRRAQAERQLFVSAPERWSETERIEQRKRALNPNTWLTEHPINVAKATQSKTLHPSFPTDDPEGQNTTHLSVVDGEGNLVSMTVTLSGSFGARVVTQDTGIILNNSAASFSGAGANTPLGGVRTTSSMSPTFLLEKDASLVLGSPGGDTIPSTVTQLVVHLAVDGKSLTDAVRAPRIHQTFAPGHLLIEPEQPLSADMKKKLRALGHEVSNAKSGMGDANIAAWIRGEAFAVCDPREGGLALGAQEKEMQPEPSTPSAPSSGATAAPAP